MLPVLIKNTDFKLEIDHFRTKMSSSEPKIQILNWKLIIFGQKWPLLHFKGSIFDDKLSHLWSGVLKKRFYKKG